MFSVGYGQEKELTVAAAADLSNLTGELAQAFEKANPGIKVKFVTQASAMLAQQIENGAPYDVFLSANAAFVDKLLTEGKIEPPTPVYATGRLAILWRDGRSHPISMLAEPWVKAIAMANPKLAPYGLAAQQALEHERLLTQIESKIVYGENVRQTLQLFDSGNADAVLTSAGLVNERHPQLIPDDWHQAIVQKAGVVKASEQREEARRFLKFLTSAEAQAIFVRHGMRA